MIINCHTRIFEVTQFSNGIDFTLPGSTADRYIYAYSYDSFGRLTESARYAGFSMNPNNIFTEKNLTYDGNGNMTLDALRSITLTYDINNLVSTVSRNDMLLSTYHYLADGTKYKVIDPDNNGRVYIGPFSYTTALFVRDHLGSTRVMLNAQGDILERNAYYPFGLQMNQGKAYPTLTQRLPQLYSGYVSSTTARRDLYNGKELQTAAGTDYLDYGFRQYDQTIARWFNIDPKAEKYFYSSPIAYCRNFPVYLIDLYGEDDYRYDKKTGEFILMNKTDDITDRVLNYKTKPDKETGDYHLKNNRVLISNIEKGILHNGVNFKERDNIIAVGGENGPTLIGVHNFVIDLSDMVGLEIAGYDYSKNTEEFVTNVCIGRYYSTKDVNSRRNTPTKAYCNFNVALAGQSIEETIFIAQFHTHLSSYSIEERTKPSGEKDGQGDISYKNNQKIFGIKHFIILTRGYAPIEY